jgi:hypothetical protein
MTLLRLRLVRARAPKLSPSIGHDERLVQLQRMRIDAAPPNAVDVEARHPWTGTLIVRPRLVWMLFANPTALAVAQHGTSESTVGDASTAEPVSWPSPRASGAWISWGLRPMRSQAGPPATCRCLDRRRVRDGRCGSDTSHLRADDPRFRYAESEDRTRDIATAQHKV